MKSPHPVLFFTDDVSQAIATTLSLLVFGLFVGCAGSVTDRKDREPNSEWQSSFKRVITLGQPWEKEFGYVQSVRAQDTVYISGQMGINGEGILENKEDMEAQMRQAYSNVAKILQEYHADMQNVVEEVMFVTNMNSAMTVTPKVRKEFYGQEPQVTTTLVQVDRLAFPDALVEIKVTAELQFLPRFQGGGRSGKGGGRGEGRGGHGGRGGRGGFSGF